MELLLDPYRIKVWMRTEVLVVANEHAEWADQWMKLSFEETVVKCPNAFRGGTSFRGSWLLGVTKIHTTAFHFIVAWSRTKCRSEIMCCVVWIKFEGHSYSVFCNGLHNTYSALALQLQKVQWRGGHRLALGSALGILDKYYARVLLARNPGLTTYSRDAPSLLRLSLSRGCPSRSKEIASKFLFFFQLYTTCMPKIKKYSPWKASVCRSSTNHLSHKLVFSES